MLTAQLKPLPTVPDTCPPGYIVPVECEILRETDKAFQIRRGERVAWVPKSAARTTKQTPEGVTTLVLKVWLFRRVVEQMK